MLDLVSSYVCYRAYREDHLSQVDSFYPRLDVVEREYSFERGNRAV